MPRRATNWHSIRRRPLELGLVPGAERRTLATPLGPARYVVAGTGPPVILLHGLDGSARWWTPTIRGLQARFRCYALDFVRFERWSERGRVPLPHAGEYVEAWLAALGLERAHVVAHSMGAYAAVSLATRSPHAIDRLVLIAPAGLLRQRIGLGEAGRALGFLGSMSPSLAPVLAVDSALTGPLRFLRSARELARAEPPDLSRISAPTLLVWGTRDRLVPPANAALLRERIPGARVVYLDGARHVPMFERPDDCNDVIARFLAGEAVGEARSMPATASGAG